jgi:putative membrane protein
MLYVNYLALSLVAVTAVLFAAARFVLVEEAEQGNRGAYAFAAAAGGAVMAVTGFHLSLTWPLPAQYNIAFGEPLAYFGSLLIAGAAALRRGASLRPLSALAAFGGIATVLVAGAIARYGLTWIPVRASAAIGSAGLAALCFPLRARHPALRAATFALLLVSGAVFATIAAQAVVHHLAPGSFDRWSPAPVRGA